MAEYKDDDMAKRIKNSVNVPVPDSLKPDNIEKMLEDKKAQQSTKAGTKKYKNRKYKFIYGGIAVAAAFAIGTTALFTGVLPGWRGQSKGNDGILDNIKGFVEGVDSDRDGQVEGLLQAENYEEVYDYFKAYERSYDYAYSGSIKGDVMAEVEMETAEDEVVMNESAYESMESVDSDSMQNSMTSTQNSTTTQSDDDYSTTNVQEEGVAEADIVLTDGEYIYILQRETYRYVTSSYRRERCNPAVYIVKPDKTTGKMTSVSEIVFEGKSEDMETQIQEMYLSGDNLVIIASNYYENSQLLTYDISNREKPVQVGEIEVNGGYEDSRLVDGNVYLFTNTYPGNYYDRIFTNEEEMVIPCVEDELLPPEDIYMPEIECAQSYLIGVSASLEEPDKVKDQFAVLMNSSEIYVSQNHIYITEREYGTFNDGTIISKFAYKDGCMKAVASGMVEGTINDAFSMDEHNGYLRMVTTKTKYKIYETTTINQLYVLNENLEVVGEIENLAEDETIYSARFMGDKGYFVTYRQVDPLFSVDLSDPENPVVLGELKISGFSEYLHPYGEDKLLGIGWETTLYNEGDFERLTTDGMKLSMFDVSDMTDVKEQDKVVMEDVVNMIVGAEHKAVMVNAQKNLFGFAVLCQKQWDMEMLYRTYRYVEGQGFELVTETTLSEEADLYAVRGIYIGDILYVVDGLKVQAVSLNRGNVLDELELVVK